MEQTISFAEKYKQLQDKRSTLLQDVDDINEELQQMNAEAEKVLELAGLKRKRTNTREKTSEESIV